MSVGSQLPSASAHLSATAHGLVHSLALAASTSAVALARIDWLFRPTICPNSIGSAFMLSAFRNTSTRMQLLKPSLSGSQSAAGVSGNVMFWVMSTNGDWPHTRFDRAAQNAFCFAGPESDRSMKLS